MPKTIQTVQIEISQALEQLTLLAAQLPPTLKPLLEHVTPPPGRQVVVSLRRGDRQVKKTAKAESWSPESGELRISFPPLPDEGRRAEPLENSQLEKKAEQLAEDPRRDLVRALARAERVQRRFVALKWFRDKFLPQQGFAWAAALEARHAVLRQAIDNRWVLTNKVINPTAPEFPTTTIRLNSPHPKVQEMLSGTVPPDTDFHPVAIRGVPLSETILADRR